MQWIMMMMVAGLVVCVIDLVCNHIQLREKWAYLLDCNLLHVLTYAK